MFYYARMELVDNNHPHVVYASSNGAVNLDTGFDWPDWYRSGDTIKFPKTVADMVNDLCNSGKTEAASEAVYSYITARKRKTITS